MRSILIFLLCLQVNFFQYCRAQTNTQPVAYTAAGAVYSQNFDGLPFSGTFSLSGKGPLNLTNTPINGTSLNGWQFMMLSGTGSAAAFAAGTGSSTAAGLYSLGNTGSADRALGSLASGSGVYAFGVLLTNNTGGILNSFTLSFTAEQWRKGGSTNKNTWAFRYRTGNLTDINPGSLISDSSLNFGSVITTASGTSLNGNLSDNRQPVSATIRSIIWKPGEQLLLRWDDADETGSDDVCAIDNLTFSATLFSALPVLSNDSVSNITDSSVWLNATVNDNFSGTAVFIEYDTSRLLNHPVMLHTSPDSVIAGTGNTAVSLFLNGLIPGTHYYCRITIRNSNGTVTGVLHDFTTSKTRIKDTVPPEIVSVTIPDKSMKKGDTISVAISVVPDAGIYYIQEASINGYPLSSLQKVNDSNYTMRLIIPAAGTDVPENNDIPVRISLKDSAGNISTLYQNPIRQTADRIDFTAPYIISFNPPQSRTYSSIDTLYFIFRFNEKIFISSAVNTAALSITIGNRTKSALYYTGSGTDHLVFRYIIQNGENDKDGVRAALSITLNDASVIDMAGYTANLSYSGAGILTGVLVDATAPVVSSVNVPAGRTYKTGDTLFFTVNYSKKIWLNPSDSLPSLSIVIGSNTREVFYLSGSGSGTLLFGYRVRHDDFDKDGIKANNTINLHGVLLKDEFGNTASAGLSSMGSMSGIRINPPSITLVSVTQPDRQVYKTSDTIRFLVDYNEPVLVNTEKGIPGIKFTAGKSIKQALYVKGPVSSRLIFQYAVQPGDEDPDGIVPGTGITANSAILTDTLLNTAPLQFNQPLQTAGISIDAVAPVSRNLIMPPNAIYRMDDMIEISVLFSERIKINAGPDTPKLLITAGVKTQYANYSSMPDTNRLLFRYTVKQGDLDKNGIKIGSSIINFRSITDMAGNISSSALINAGIFSGIVIDGVVPSFTQKKNDTIPVCENSRSINFSPFLSVTDAESNETVTWNVSQTLQKGQLNKWIYTGQSNGKTILPSDYLFTPAENQTGIDSAEVQITDGVYFEKKKIYFDIIPSIKNNNPGASQIICIEQSPGLIKVSAPDGGNHLYQFIWESSAADSLHFKKAEGTSNLADYQPPILKSNTWFRRIIQSGSCTDTSLSLKITPLKTGVWTGLQSNEWNSIANWCGNQLPDNNTDVLIPGNAIYFPVIKDSAKCRNIVLNSGSRLTIKGIWQLYGNIQNESGILMSDSGTVFLKGNNPQNISGNAFSKHQIKNLMIQNTKGITINDSLCITGNILLHSGVLETNRQLFLEKNAMVGPSASGTRISGEISIAHEIKGGRRSFHLLAHPFANDMGLQSVKDSLDITGNGGTVNGFTQTATNQPSAFSYDALSGNDSAGVDAGWAPVSSIRKTGGTEWKKYSGIRLLMRGKAGQGLDGTPAGNGSAGTYLPESVTIRVTGEINTGDQEIILTKGKYAGYNLIANPYPANIDLSLTTRGNGTGMHYWIWNPWQGRKGGYTGIPFRSKYILPAFGAFIVKANSIVNNQLVFTENTKTTEPAPDSIPVTDISDTYHLELRLYTDSIFWDRLLILATDTASNGYEKNDAEKPDNPEVNFYSHSKELKKLSIDARPVNNETVIPLGIQTTETGHFTIRIAKAGMPPSCTLQLHDRFLNKWTPLTTDSSYHFQITGDTAGLGNKRFEIISPQKKTSISSAGSNLISIQATPVPVSDQLNISFSTEEAGNTTIRLLTLSGVPVVNIPMGIQNKGRAMIPLGHLKTGIYLLEIKCGDKIGSRKIVKK